jgi:hypothetical protein
MEFAEYPLLNTPHLTVVVLKAARSADATVDGAVTLLRTMLRRLKVEAPFDDATLRSRLRQVAAYLSEAGLLEIRPDDGIVITGRGRRVIAEHPAGFDTADLVSDAEIQRRIREHRRRASSSDPRTQQYADGYNAFREGAQITDNPFAPDANDHLAWEDGWCEARDDTATHDAMFRGDAAKSMPR